MKYSHTATDLAIENQYPKLVRDKIPEIVLENEGKTAATRVLSNDQEYLEFLLRKLIEEATELSKAETDDNRVEELADVMEVFEAILELKGITQNDVTKVQEQKRQKRGGFKKRLLMVSKP